MNANDFLSERRYLLLPTSANPRVFIPIDDHKIADLSFDLYHPFSKKAKFLKCVMWALCVKLNTFANLLLPTVQGSKSEFLIYLESKLERKLTTSVYIATAKDKVVVQLQSNLKVYGYLKYPLSTIGAQRMLNEQQGIAILSKLNIVPDVLLNDRYLGMPFIIIQNLKGVIGNIDDSKYHQVLNKLKKDNVYKLEEHPRIIDLKRKLIALNLPDIFDVLRGVISSSKNEYLEVFEHGDFAPWNLIYTKQGLIPFDFEYFEEYGLEYLDEIKYHFQIENLLHGKVGIELIKTISLNVGIEEFGVIFKIFLIKEIINKIESNESSAFEKSLLKLSF